MSVTTVMRKANLNPSCTERGKTVHRSPLTFAPILPRTAVLPYRLTNPNRGRNAPCYFIISFNCKTMKTIEQLTNVEKAKIIFDLFKSEIPAFLEYTQAIADKVTNTQEELIANWNNPFLSYHQWL